MMRKTFLNIFKILLIVNALLTLLSLLFFDIGRLYTIQIGFISSTLVMIASVISYKRMVNTRVEHNIITVDDSKDVIEKLEDPYDLYSDDSVVQEKVDLSQSIKEEKKKLKENRRTLSQTLKDTKAALSLYRIGAYAILILGFLYLNRQGLLHIPSYLLALGIPPVVIVMMLLKEK
ncbi:MAG: hypothetical protein U9O64_06145 [Campylobacterota bacterium]|nr:hypothetical protein [Campylobacterota bacterium]